MSADARQQCAVVQNRGDLIVRVVVKQMVDSFKISGLVLCFSRQQSGLALGGTTETVRVDADVSPLGTETANSGTNMKGQDLTILPLSVAGGRNVLQFAFATVPTVEGMGTGYELQAGSRVAGSQGVTKAVVVDGTDFNAGTQGVQPPPGMESVQQFSGERIRSRPAAARSYTP